MAYFNRLPVGTYNDDNSIDLHKKLILSKPIDQDWLMSYDLQDGETLHDVSYSLYDTVDYWWLIALMNQYDDVHYDMMIKDDTLQKLAKQLQVMELPDTFSYILFPPKCKIEYQMGGKNYTGTVIRKYIFNVAGEGGKFLIDVLLDDIDSPMPDTLNLTVIDSTVFNVKVVDDGSYKNGDLVRQDLMVNVDELEEFARGTIIYKDGNDLYIDKSKSPDFVASGDTYTLNGKVVTGAELALSKKVYIEGSDITLAEKVSTFSVNEFGLRDLYYLYRYDKLVNINDKKQKLMVIKPSYLNILKNNLIIIEEE